MENDDDSRNVLGLTTRRDIEDKEWRGSEFTTRRENVKNTSKQKSREKKEKVSEAKSKNL